jgi:hypothetical protein
MRPDVLIDSRAMPMRSAAGIAVEAALCSRGVAALT